MAPHLPDAARPSHATFDGQTWDLPASDADRLAVMVPLTPAGRQHLAFVEERCRTVCLRASKNSRPLRCMTFRGSIPQPMQQLCTLRVRHCCRLTQHSLPGGPLPPYPGRTCPGSWRQLWLAPSHSITSSARASSVVEMSSPSTLAALRLRNVS